MDISQAGTHRPQTSAQLDAASLLLDERVAGLGRRIGQSIAERYQAEDRLDDHDRRVCCGEHFSDPHAAGCTVGDAEELALELEEA